MIGWLVALSIVGLGLHSRRPLAASVRTLLLLSEMFAPAPCRPLRVITRPPIHDHVELAPPPDAVIADVFAPRPWLPCRRRSSPAVILCAGVKTSPENREVIFRLGAALARLGYVTVWPRLAMLDRGTSVLEDPSTFVCAFRYVEKMEAVDPARITLAGFSVGSSIALIAATDPLIANRVRGVLFFGGYYDAFDYLVSVATGVAHCDGRGDGRATNWRADDGAVTHIREIFEEGRAVHLLRALAARTEEEARDILRSAPEDELVRLRRANPAERIQALVAPIFILHDEGDHYVPYCESVKLNQALGSRKGKSFLITHLFEHTVPRSALTPATALEFARLHRFLATVFDAL